MSLPALHFHRRKASRGSPYQVGLCHGERKGQRCQSSAHYRVLLLGYPTGVALCRVCRGSWQATWDEALAGFPEEKAA
jgi:hypothetical protein